MTSSSSWNHLDHETRASTPQSAHMIDEEPVSQNQRLEVIRQSQVAFLAPTPPLPLLTRDSEAEFNEHLDEMHARDFEAQTLSQGLLARQLTQDLTQAPSHRVNGEASYLAESQHPPPASSLAIPVTSLLPVPHSSEAINNAVEDPLGTAAAPFNSVANSTEAHPSKAIPAAPTSPISGNLGSEAARTRTHHAPKQRKSNRHHRSFVKWVRKRFRKQGPWTPACFHDKTAGENAIKRAENHGF